MASVSILGASKLVAFVPSADLARARQFYEGVLGLKVVSDEPHLAVVLDANGTMVRVTLVSNHAPAPFTILGWGVSAIGETVARLTEAGVEFLRYPGLNDSGASPVWKAPSGARIAWFHDADKNVLSITQF